MFHLEGLIPGLQL
jgi:hypothetical protein